jgi:hypothetical protein
MATNQDQIASSVLQFVNTLSPITVHQKISFPCFERGNRFMQSRYHRYSTSTSNWIGYYNFLLLVLDGYSNFVIDIMVVFLCRVLIVLSLHTKIFKQQEFSQFLFMVFYFLYLNNYSVHCCRFFLIKSRLSDVLFSKSSSPHLYIITEFFVYAVDTQIYIRHMYDNTRSAVSFLAWREP